MARFNATVLTLAAGAVLGTALRPGLLEIAVVAGLVCVLAAVYRPAVVRRRVAHTA